MLLKSSQFGRKGSLTMEQQEKLKRLERAMENELYIVGLLRLAHPDKYSVDYAQGYIEAIQNVLDKLKEIR